MARFRLQRTGQRILDDIQAALSNLQNQVQSAPLREETIYRSATLIAANTINALPWAPVLTPRRLVGAAIVVSATLAANTTNARIFRILRYRGGVLSAVAARLDTTATTLPAFRIVPFGFGSVDDLAFAAGDVVVLDIGQVGVGPQITGAVVHLVWDVEPS